MFSKEGKKGDFLKDHPNFETFLTNLYEDEVERANKETKYLKDRYDLNKEYLIDNLNQKVSYNTSKFKNSSEQGFKYKLELLGNEDSNYKLLKESLSLDKKVDLWLERHRFGNYKFKIDENHVVKLYNIYKIIRTDDVQTGFDCKQLLLLHGTKASNVEGILKEGFKPSKHGSYGPGVYLTNSGNMACKYGRCYGQENGIVKKLTYLFVNRIKPTDEPKPPRKFNETYEEYQKNEPFLQAFNPKTKDLVSLEDNDQCYIDNKFNKIVQGKFQKVNPKIFLAHQDLVTPAFLIEIEEQQNATIFAKDILYNPFRGVKKYTTEENELPVESQMSKEDDMCSLENLNKALDEEIIVNHNAHLKLINSRPNYKIYSVIEQFLFKVESLFESNKDEKVKYRAEVLQGEDEDYFFILRSLTTKNSFDHPKIHHMFKIRPVDQNEVSKTGGNPLYLHGVKSHKVENVMKFGYTNDIWSSEQSCMVEGCKEGCWSIDCVRKCSDDFNLEYCKGF